MSEQLLFSSPCHEMNLVDIDLDGDLDLIVAYDDLDTIDTYGDNEPNPVYDELLEEALYWFENDGSGSFGVQHIIAQGLKNCRAFTCEDYDQDGDMDLVALSTSHDNIYLIQNLGNMSFEEPEILDFEVDGPCDLLFEDLDQDGVNDLVVCSKKDGRLTWYPNTLQFNEQIVLADNVNDIFAIESQDLDSDGDMDLLAISKNEGKLFLIECIHPGQFSDPVVIDSGLSAPRDLISEDLDGDGLAEIVVIVNSGRPHLYSNLSNLVFSDPELLSVDYTNAKKIVAADLELDGDLDLFVVASYQLTVNVHVNDGSSQFSLTRIHREIDPWSNWQPKGFYTMAVGDYDNNGLQDVTVAYGRTGGVYQKTNQDSVWAELRLVTPHVREIAKGDIDSDGDQDIVVKTNVGTLTSFLNEGGQVRLQSKIYEVVPRSSPPYLIDHDMDGDLDIVSSTGTLGKLGAHGNDGNGHFGQRQMISTAPLEIRKTFLVDIDADGIQDVLCGTPSSLIWFRGLGQGQYSDIQVIENTYYTKILPFDLENDGDIDIFVGSYSYIDDSYYVLVQSNGQFEKEEAGTYGPFWFDSEYVADIDNDGFDDIILESSNNNPFYRCLLNMSGQLSNPIALFHDDGERSLGVVKVLDYDEDGDPDIIRRHDISFKNSQLIINENIGGGFFLPNDSILAERVIGHFDLFDIDNSGSQELIVATEYSPVKSYEFQVNYGCTDMSACNYDPNATEDDESCLYSLCGCTDPQALNFDSLASIENGTCIYLSGCMDPIAENYDPDAVFSNDSCEYIYGCTTLGAENYNPSATMDDGSCGFSVLGIVYYDENENGEVDSTEYGLPFQQVYSLPDSMLLITDDHGRFFFNASGNDNYSYSLVSNPLFPFHTTPQTLTFDASQDNWNQSVHFGISNEEPDFEICIDLYPTGNGYPCDQLSNHNICFRNMGNRPIDGVIELTYDSLFQGHQAVQPIDSVNGNTVYMSYQNLLPGQMFFYDLKLHTPTVDHIGEILSSHVNIYGYFEGQEVAFGERTLEMEVTCAYDPNDKQVYPFGYTDSHYIDNDTILEYLIRFQNTGNAPATDVLLRDTIDTNLDLHSFRLVANSHSVLTSIDPETREVVFDFSGIMLPDSVNNEPQSHGLISYKIRPKTALEPETVIHNEAAIFFDNNPPIITNETWSSIFSCDSIQVVSNLDSVSLCLGEEVLLSSQTEFVEDVEWHIYGTLMSDSSSMLFSSNIPFDAEILLIGSNPLCAKEVSIPLHVEETLFAEIIPSGSEFCPGDSVLLTTSLGPGENAMWFYEADTLSQYSSLYVSSEGLYALRIDDGTCISQLDGVELSLAPEPTAPVIEFISGGLSVEFQSGHSYQWYLNGETILDATGHEWQPESDGSYSIEVFNSSGCSSSSETYVWITGLEQLNGHVINLFPNPMTDRAILDLGELRGEVLLEIIDMGAKLVRSQTQNAEERFLEIPRGNLAQGNYILRLTSQGQRYEMKMGVE